MNNPETQATKPNQHGPHQKQEMNTQVFANGNSSCFLYDTHHEIRISRFHFTWEKRNDL